MANKPEEFPIFTPLDEAIMEKLMAKIPRYLRNIAYTFFINMLYAEASKRKRKVNIKSELMKNTLYAFQHRDLNKGAIMALAESLLY